MNQNDLKFLYLHYAIRNELGRYIKQFSTVTKDQNICLNRINEQILKLRESGKEPKQVLARNNYTYEILLENAGQLDTPHGRIYVSYEPRSGPINECIDVEVM